MARLSVKLKGKKEELIAPLSSIPIDEHRLLSSGLSLSEVGFVEKWVKGSISGRSCLFQLLHERMARQIAKNGKIKTVELDAASSSHIGAVGTKSRGDKGNGDDSVEMKGVPTELAILSSSVNLPSNFLCDSGYLFETIFSKAPIEVLRGAIDLIRSNALDGDIVNLDADQINLALKQLKVTFFVDDLSDGGAGEEKEEKESKDGGETLDTTKNDGTESSNDDDFANEVELKRKGSGKNVPRHLVGDKELHFQVLLELVRQHVRENNLASSDAESSEKGTKNEPSSAADNGRLKQNLDADHLSSHLELPIERVIKGALVTDVKELEQGNNVLKPYISQLSSFKASLADQLKHLQDNASFLKLGITKDCSDSAIKKAYHSMAVKCHPDKGGDKQQFQALQDAYQEVLKKKKALDLEREAMDEARGELGVDTATAKEAAESVVDRVQAQMQAIKEAAEKCAQLAQLTLHWQKVIESAAGPALTSEVIEEGVKQGISTEFSTGARAQVELPKAHGGRRAAKQALGKLIPLLFDLDMHLREDNDADGTPLRVNGQRIDMQSCAVRHAVRPLEVLCEGMQASAAVAMELPSCGDRYGSASTAAGSSFVPTVEACMGNGVELLQHVTTLMEVDSQVEACLSRIQTSDEYREIRFGVPRADTSHRRRQRKKQRMRRNAQQQISDRLEKRIEERVARRMELEQRRVQWAVEQGVELGDDEFDRFVQEDLRRTEEEDEEDELFFLKAYEEQIREDAEEDDDGDDDDDDDDDSCSSVSTDLVSSDDDDDDDLLALLDSDSSLDSDLAALDVHLGDSDDDDGGDGDGDGDDDSIDRLIRKTDKQQRRFDRRQQRRQQKKMERKRQKKAARRSKMEILVEMAVTALRSAAVSLNMAGERAMASALVSVDLMKAVTEVVQRVDEDLAEEVARKAKSREAEEAEGSYSEEDQAALSKMRQEAAEEEHARRQAQMAAEAEEEEKKRKENDDEDRRAVEEEGGDEALREAKLEKRRTDRELSHLKDKIQKLQVQLRVQHVQALQTMNAEARALQSKIQKQLDCAEHKQSGGPRALALVADFLDSSLIELRADTELFVSGMLSRDGEGGGQGGPSRMRRDLGEMVRRHLGWVLDVCPGATRLLGWRQKQEQEQEQEQERGSRDGACGGEQEEKSSSDMGSAESAGESESDKGEGEGVGAARMLALLPDSRSKALWMAWLLDSAGLEGLVRGELQRKLVFLDSACMNSLAAEAQASSRKQAPEHNAGEEEGRISFSRVLCNLVVTGLQSARHSGTEAGAEGASAEM